MNRLQTIKKLERKISEAEDDRISQRLRDCNVRAVMTDWSTKRSDIKSRIKSAEVMKKNENISHFEYLFNGEWKKLT